MLQHVASCQEKLDMYTGFPAYLLTLHQRMLPIQLSFLQTIQTQLSMAQHVSRRDQTASERVQALLMGGASEHQPSNAQFLSFCPLYCSTDRPNQLQLAPHNARSGASGPKEPPAAMLKVEHKNIDGDCRTSMKPCSWMLRTVSGRSPGEPIRRCTSPASVPKKVAKRTV